MNMRVLVGAVLGVSLLAFGFAVGLSRKASSPFAKEESDPASAPTQVVALYDPRPTKPASPDPLGVHVADVGIGPKGVKLLAAPDAEISDALKAALAELSARPFLPAMGESEGAGGTSMGAAETKPGDPQYPWAVGGFLRERTGLRYDVRPYKPKTP